MKSEIQLLTIVFVTKHNFPRDLLSFVFGDDLDAEVAQVKQVDADEDGETEGEHVESVEEMLQRKKKEGGKKRKAAWIDEDDENTL